MWYLWFLLGFRSLGALVGEGSYQGRSDALVPTGFLLLLVRHLLLLARHLFLLQITVLVEKVRQDIFMLIAVLQ